MHSDSDNHTGDNSSTPKDFQLKEYLRAVLLMLYFFLIIGGYYLLKPLSRTLYITYLGADNLPYVWFVSVAALAVIVPLFHKFANQISASVVARSTTLSFVAILAGFLALLNTPNSTSAFLFYVTVDVFSVILVEVFWSLTNSSYREDSGKGWYGFLASGGLLGGIAGGAASSYLIDNYKLAPMQLIYPSIATLLASLVLVLALFKEQFVADKLPRSVLTKESLNQFYQRLKSSPEARLVLYILCFSQLIEPLVEYQFMSSVENSGASLKEQTSYVSDVLVWVSAFGLAMSIVFIPILHRIFGTFGGLILQPLLIGALSFVNILKGSLAMSSLLKISDRGLAYSTGRASKELLYVRLDGDTNFRLKAWIDVLGYRLFRILGSATVLVATFIAGSMISPATFVLVITLTLAMLWFTLLIRLRPRD